MTLSHCFISVVKSSLPVSRPESTNVEVNFFWPYWWDETVVPKAGGSKYIASTDWDHRHAHHSWGAFLVFCLLELTWLQECRFTSIFEEDWTLGMVAIHGLEEADTQEGMRRRTEAPFTETGKVEMKETGKQRLWSELPVCPNGGLENPHHLDSSQGTVKHQKCFYKWKVGW